MVFVGASEREAQVKTLLRMTGGDPPQRMRLEPIVWRGGAGGDGAVGGWSLFAGSDPSIGARIVYLRGLGGWNWWAMGGETGAARRLGEAMAEAEEAIGRELDRQERDALCLASAEAE